MPNWINLSRVWTTVRELDVHAIRQESERAVALACFGQPALLDALANLLYNERQDMDGKSASHSRYGAVGSDPIYRYPLTAMGSSFDPQRADMLLLVLDGRQPPDPVAARNLGPIFRNTSLPFLAVVLHVDRLPNLSTENGLSPAIQSQVVFIPDPNAPDAGQLLSTALLGRLPSELHLAAARRLPGLRATVARDLVNSTSMSNASYALISAIPEQFPVLDIPVAAADILVLTKNQVMMTYRLALAHGAPPDFQACLREMVSIVGAAYLWRQIARILIGLIPVIGVLPKIAVAYGGTRAVGVTAWRWFATGELVSKDQIQHISQEAMGRGHELTEKFRTQVGKSIQEAPAGVRRLLSRSR